jgi:carboxyl-terminal processing protease
LLDTYLKAASLITRSFKTSIVLWVIASLGRTVAAQPSASQQNRLNVESFELVWSTLRDQYWDKTMAGLNWQSVHNNYIKEVKAAGTADEARSVMIRMLELLPSSHLAIIPGELYSAGRNAGNSRASEPAVDAGDQESDDSGSTGLGVIVIDGRIVVEAVEENSGGARAGVRPGWVIDSVDGAATQRLSAISSISQSRTRGNLAAEIVQSWLSGPVGSHARVSFTNGEGKAVACDIERQPSPGEVVRFGNLPPERVRIEHRRLENGVGYIRLNLFLDPPKVMPEVERSVIEFANAPGIVLDIRNNPGGLGIMAMGIAGWFVAEDGQRLGTMTGRGEIMNFIVNPRLHAYRGRVAILVNGGSASTSEILAQGLRDLGRARIFGTRTAGAALPSDIIRLPNGDRFQYPEANYASAKGRVLEGNGVEPDVVIAPTIQALLSGRDLALDAASEWCSGKK